MMQRQHRIHEVGHMPCAAAADQDFQIRSRMSDRHGPTTGFQLTNKPTPPSIQAQG
jgi:hypothetical protein